MNKLLKITQTLIFTILILLVIVFIWQFFNNYAQLLFLPLGVLSIYYLLIYLFAKLLQRQQSKMWFYVGIIFIIIPLIAFSLAYKPVLEFSYNILQSLSN
ncbi:hypothetical protein NU10_00940 [Flavobacterium dauae]|uniref:hypothetical protein n=1 Tax=Flavobacterium dauae TaxID=1563479 RepID=UPI00101B312D|nr:hypothetical protein [Flavobacterium dauae]WLD23987.1 hypothetical protein NU10_00940 [Flavobacterium dauae]